MSLKPAPTRDAVVMRSRGEVKAIEAPCRPSDMKPIDILKLVGFATGAALHFYIAWLIWKRRRGPSQRAAQPERLVNVLNLCLAVWFLGNLFTTLHVLLLTGQRLTFLLRIWDTIAMTGVALLPAALLHAHIATWASFDGYRRWSESKVARAGWLLYLPMTFLPYAIYRINSGDYRPYLSKLHVLLIPYSVYYLVNSSLSAFLDLKIRDRLDQSAFRERTFLNRLAVLLVLNAIFEFVVVAILGSGPNDAPWVAFVLSSLFPIFFVAYHVYRYRFVDVAVREGLVYAAFALLFIAVYTYGVRRVDQFLVEKFEIKPGVVEVILILGMVALASPLVRVIDRAVHRLFTREIGLYRDVVRQVSAGAGGFGELSSLIRYAEETIRRGLDVTSVRIVPLRTGDKEGPEQKIAGRMTQAGVDVIENDEELRIAGASIAYALRREGELIGLMMINVEPHSLTSEKRAILDVLASQVAIEVETLQLVEDKIRLERELAHRERLATLGQMAAQVAHEVKNPLSSIKSIVQVMREESAAVQFDRDLRLIVTEIDRLNRTVSQLLAFSRPGRADAQPAGLSDLVQSTVTFASAEAGERGVDVRVEANCDVQLEGVLAGALREALSNLILNGVQACRRGDVVMVRANTEGRQLVIEIIDDGPGIPLEEQQKVFEPFYSTKSRGTGLGLAIVQRRVTDVGGMLELTSPVANGHGTRFRIAVPFNRKDGIVVNGSGDAAAKDTDRGS